MSSSYVPPSKRKEELLANPLAPENYPSLGTTNQAPAKPVLNFLKRIQESEEERHQREELAASLDPNGIQGLTKAALEGRGWAVLSLRQEDVHQTCDRLAALSADCSAEN